MGAIIFHGANGSIETVGIISDAFILALCNIVVRFGSFINGEVDIFLGLKLVGYNTNFSEEGDTIFLCNMDRLKRSEDFIKRFF